MASRPKAPGVYVDTVDLAEIMSATVPPQATTVFPARISMSELVDMCQTVGGGPEEYLALAPEAMAELMADVDRMTGVTPPSGIEHVSIQGITGPIRVVVSEHLPEGTAAMLVAGRPEDSVAIMRDFKEKVLAELRYEFDGTTWAALVTVSPDGDGYQLWFQRGDRFQRSGTFSNGKALVKYIREQAKAKFEGFAPVKDTLNRIRVAGSPSSVVPKCYGDPPQLVSGGPNLWVPKDPKCRKCPYMKACLAESTGIPLAEETAQAAAEPEEPEELFRKRLQDKIKAQWGEK